MWTGYVDVKGMVQCITQLCYVLVDVNTQVSIFYSSTQFWDILFNAKVGSIVISSSKLFSLKDECGQNVEIIKAAGIQYINREGPESGLIASTTLLNIYEYTNRSQYGD